MGLTTEMMCNPDTGKLAGKAETAFREGQFQEAAGIYQELLETDSNKQMHVADGNNSWLRAQVHLF